MSETIQMTMTLETNAKRFLALLLEIRGTWSRARVPLLAFWGVPQTLYLLVGWAEQYQQLGHRKAHSGVAGEQPEWSFPLSWTRMARPLAHPVALVQSGNK